MVNFVMAQVENTQLNKPSINPIIKKILDKRGLDERGIHEFLSWNLKTMPSLTNLIDIEKASRRIIKAIESQEKIGIYGDYDVDGTTSCALFYHFFKMLNIEVELIQPSRFVEGYGIHPSNIEQACSNGVSLLITVDCGITNNEAAEYALEKGLDLIITDHHKDARDEMPKAYAIVNPNRRDEPEDSKLKVLAGVGVAFAVCVKVRELLESEGKTIPSLYPLLQFVAIGTICDLARLEPVNLKLVRHGLKQIPETKYNGIRSFFSPEERERGFVPSEKLSFQIGPAINSKGRLDHPEKALKLLICDNNEEAYEHYSHLQACNNERKYIQGTVFSEAREQVKNQMESGHHVVSIVYDESWHEGVIGIVASKLVETFNAPAVVFTQSSEKGIIKASVRSAGDLNIFNVLKECEDLFVKFGGHKAAAGLSMPLENLPEFKKRMISIIEKVPEIERTNQETYDVEISAGDINLNLIKSLELLEPFGMGNAKPIFKMKDVKIQSFDILKDVHVRWNFKYESPKGNIYHKGISFNYLNKWNVLHPEKIFQGQLNQDLSVYFTLGINRFNGNDYIQLMVDRIELGDF